MSEVQTIEHEPTRAVVQQNIAPQPIAGPPMAMLEKMVAERGWPAPEIVEQWMTLHERWEDRQRKAAFDAAFAAAKAEIPVIKKNRHVGFKAKDKSKGDTSYWHEDLGEIVETVTPILANHGLGHGFSAEVTPEGLVIVTCHLVHKDGYSRSVTLPGGKDTTGNKNVHQALGSALTYLQRYSLKAILGIAAARDDDGQSAEQEEMISEEQVIELREGLEAIAQTGGSDGKPFDTKATIKRFCDALQIELLGDLPVSRLQEAKDLLAQGRGKK